MAVSSDCENRGVVENKKGIDVAEDTLHTTLTRLDNVCTRIHTTFEPVIKEVPNLAEENDKAGCESTCQFDKLINHTILRLCAVVDSLNDACNRSAV